MMDAQFIVAGADERSQAASLPMKRERSPSKSASEVLEHNISSGRRASAPTRFRRLRTGRACVTCHARKVRCDAASLGVPCTNCLAFSMECTVPTRNRKGKKAENTDNTRQPGDKPTPILPLPAGDFRKTSTVGYPETPIKPPQNAHAVPLQNLKRGEQGEDPRHYVKLVKQESNETPISEPGKVVYLVESSNLSLLINDYNESAGVVHYAMHDKTEIGCSVTTRLDKVELQMLRRRGALFLPPQTVSDDLVKIFFKWIAPVMPIINKTRFMKQYRDPNNPPSLLLQQAIFLAATRACTNAHLVDSSGSTIPAATTFYKRAKALYEASYEEDRIAIVQALILMGWYWEEPSKVTKNVFYWNGLAVTIAHGCGMHRNARESRLSNDDKRLWKRIWWTLFTRDRSVAVALGRPTHINMDDSDVETLTEEDFIDDDNANGADKLQGRKQVQFFLQYVKLCQVMDLVLLQNYSIASKSRRRNALALTECDMALADWLQGCPAELTWDLSKHEFWPAYLFSVYHTTCCLLHRRHLPPAPSGHGLGQERISKSLAVPPRSPAFQAAHAITSIMEALSDHNELRSTPPFMVYSLSSALLILVYQLHVAMPLADIITQNRIRICMDGLEQISKVWLVAKMIQNLFEHILIEKGFETCLPNGPDKIHDNSVQIINEASPDPARQKSNTVVKQVSGKAKNRVEKQGPALTPALLAHLFAALKSGTSSSSPESGASPKDGLDMNNTSHYQESSQLMGIKHGELYNSFLVFDTQNDPQVSHQFSDGRESDQSKAQTSSDMLVSQNMPLYGLLDRQSEFYMRSQIMESREASIPCSDFLAHQSSVQNTTDRSQYIPPEPTGLHQVYQTNQSGHNIFEQYYTPINNTFDQPPASTGPNVLEWIKYFGIGNNQHLPPKDG